MQFRRFLAALLAALMLFSALPFISAEDRQPESGDLWEQITALEDSALARRSSTASHIVTESDFAALSDSVARLVLQSDDYTPGSLERHGDFFFWLSADGEPNGYSPRLRAKIRQGADPGADPEACSGVETVSFAPRGGSAGSVDVAVFQPYYGIDSSFQATYSTEGTRIAKAMGGESTTYKTTAATIDAIADALERCGVVIFDSHGDTDYESGYDYTSRANTSYICLQSGAGFTAEDQKEVTGPYGKYYHAYNGGSYGNMHYYLADGTAISNHMKQNAKNSLLWMAICLGMATDGMHKPLRDKGVEVAYGYSQSVTFSGDYKYEKYFFDYMIAGRTVADAAAYMKEKVGIKDPYVDEYPAYPIFVSTEDCYPGHGNVDKAQRVYATWTLMPQYNVTAVSNNEAWGTVSVSGGVITAAPAEGYYAAGYELLEGTATVTQNGNVFSIQPETDCTVRIIFAAKTPATVRFFTPEGVQAETVNTYAGDPLVLPAPDGEPEADLHAYQFLGWAEAAMGNVTERPAYTAAGTTITVQGDADYYALYTYALKSDGGEISGFEKLTAAPKDWAGEYIITYNGSVVLDASGSITGASLGNKDAAVSILDTGMSVSGTSIAEANDRFVYVVEPSTVTAGACTIRMKTNSNYLAYTGKINALTSTTNPADPSAQWKLSFEAGVVSLQALNGTNRYLQYNTTSKQFRCYSNSMKSLTLFAGEKGTRYYTTELEYGCRHEWSAWTETSAPSCTEPGEQTRTCTLCGKAETKAVQALGHDWSETSYEWSEDLGACTASHVCLRDPGHVERETVKTAGEITVQPTVDAEGEITYTAIFVNPAFETQTETETIDRLEPPAPENPFVDVAEGAYYYDAVLWAVNAEPQITNGMDQTHFAPNGVCTRAQVVTFLWRAVGSPAPASSANPFTDVPADKYYTDAILWAVENEITSGTGKTTFSPNNACTRAQVVTFLWRAKGKPAPTSTESSFTDVSGGYYYDAVLWAVENGITKGQTDTTFAPNASCTRGQIVTFLYRAFGKSSN